MSARASRARPEAEDQEGASKGFEGQGASGHFASAPDLATLQHVAA